LLRDEALAEDALHGAFVKMIESGGALHAAENRLAFMYRVVDRACFDQLRRRKVRRTEPLDESREVSQAPPGVDVEARDAIVRILHELTESEYEVAILAHVDGASQAEICAALGLSRPTVWKRLVAIRARATRLLEVPS
jgi:RNA polymerase sigma factor (sigma-70 family)